MRDLIETLNGWFEDNKRVALATVIKTWNSAPRGTGSHMAISETMEFCGSVTAGCVEAQVVSFALDCLKKSVARRIRFGVSDEQAWEAGLSCGGEVEILVQPLPPQIFTQIRNALLNRLPITYETLVPEIESSPALTLIPESVSLPTLIEQRSGSIFINPLRPQPRLIISGGSQVSQILSVLSVAAGFEVTIIEPRRAFATPGRFANGSVIVNAWPQEYLASAELDGDTAVVALAHDPKIDDPLLSSTIRSPAFYIGALGSRQTHTARRRRLRLNGHSEDEINRICAPIGLDIGARLPGEIAVAIIAEIVAMRNSVLYKPKENLVPQQSSSLS